MRYALTFLWIISIIAFVIILFISYRQINYIVFIAISPDQLSESQITRDYYFYIGLAMFVVANALMIILDFFVKRLPKAALPIPNKEFWFSSKSKSIACKSILRTHFYAISSSINIFLILGMVYIWGYNHRDGAQIVDLSNYIYLATTLLLISLFSPWIRLSIKKENFLEREYN